jgi:hypothetical protein
MSGNANAKKPRASISRSGVGKDDPALQIVLSQLLRLLLRPFHGSNYQYVRYSWLQKYTTLLFPKLLERAAKSSITSAIRTIDSGCTPNMKKLVVFRETNGASDHLRIALTSS